MSAPHAEVAPIWPRRRSTALGLAALIALQVGVLFAVTHRSYFIADDYYHFHLAGQRTFLHYVATPIVHTYPAPGHRLVFYGLHHLFPMNYAAARVFLLVLLAAATVLLGQLVRTLARSDEWWTVVLLAPFGLSLAFVSVIDWWSAGVPVIPALFFTTLALSAWLRSFTSPRAMLWLAVTILATAAAGGFYLKFLLIPLYCVLFRLLVFPRVLGLPGGIGVLWQERARWIALAGFPALFVAVYVLSGLAGRSYVPGERPYLPYLAVGWFEVFVPLSLLNLPLRPSASADRWWAVVTCSQLAFWSIVWATWRRTALAAYGWTLLALVFAVNMLMVGSVRLPAYGVEIAYPLRYYPEIVLFVPLVLGLALRQGAERRSERGWERSRTGRTTLAAVGCLYVLSFVLQAPGIAAASDGVQARRWIENLWRDLPTARDRGVVRLVDSDVPEYVIPAWLTPLNRVSTILGLLDIVGVYNEATERLHVVQSDGRIAAATFQAISLLVSSVSDENVGQPGDQDPSRRCLDGTKVLRLRPGIEGAGRRLALRTVYASGGRGQVSLELATAPDVRTVWTLRPERGAEIVDLGTTGLQELALRGTESTPVCIERIEIGTLVPNQRTLEP
jgi:hypothetical protein